MPPPSFSSFPPIFNSFPDLDAPNAPGSSTQGRHDDPGSPRRNEKHTKDRKRDKDEDRAERAKRRKKEKRRDRGNVSDGSQDNSQERLPGSRSRRHRNDVGRSDEAAQRMQSRLFYEDHRGDGLNVKFGGLYAGDIPKYSLARRGKKILGIENRYAVKRDGKGILIDFGRGGSSQHISAQLSDPRTRRMLSSSVIKKFTPSAKTDIFYEEIGGFVRISRMIHNEYPGDPSYRAITRNGNESTQDSSEEDESVEETGSDSDTSPLSAREETLRRLEQTLKADPSSVDSWLQLLAHSLSGIPSNSKNASKAVSEITISILTRALKEHKDNEYSVLLRLKFLKAGEDVWDESKLRSEWEIALRLIDTPDIWLEWLDWRMRRGTGGIDACLADSQRAISSFSHLRDPVTQDIAKLRVFWRTVVFLRQSGYVEQATAMFQAQCELVYNAPESLQFASLDNKLNTLETFWEAEAPRVGESLSQGWRSWNDESEYATPHVTGFQQKSSSADPYVRWVSEESDAVGKRQMSLRSSDDDDGDPYATILFSDIRPLLVSLTTHQAKAMLRLIWLHFLGLRIPGLIASLSPLSLDEKWAEGPCISRSMLSILVPSCNAPDVVSSDSFAGALVGREKAYRNAFSPVKSWGFGVFGVFEDLSMFNEARRWVLLDDNNVELVRNLFRQLRTGDDRDWNVLSIEFEACIGIKGALKVSKTLLGGSQSSTILWITHARLERIRERYDDARKIYETILASPQSFGTDMVDVFWDYAEMEWLLGRNDVSRGIIFRASGQQEHVSSTGVHTLRAKKFLEDKSVDTTSHPRSRLHHFMLRMLLELLIGTIHGAVNTLESRLAHEIAGSEAHERMVMGGLRMIYHHTITLKNPAPRALLRDAAEKAVDAYPSNTIVLGVFLECEKGEGVWGRVRTLLAENSLTRLGGKNLTRRLIEVWIAGWERGRWEAEIERIKARLELATTCDETRGSPIIWRLLLEIEIKTGTHKQAKAILFRALGECPMVKELYLLAFVTLRNEFLPHELNSLADTMAERGLRLRTSLDELLEKYGSRIDNTVEAVETEEGSNELEENSSELRRLMPY